MLRNRDIQNLYIETLLKFVGNESIREYTYEECQRVYNEYIETHKWLPPEAIIDSDEVSEYDEFCDFMKWKKRALAAISAFNGMCKQKFFPTIKSNIIATITDRIIGDYKKVFGVGPNQVPLVNALLEQIHALWTCSTQSSTRSKILHIGNREAIDLIVAFIKTEYVVAETYPPSVRFKIYDLHDLVNKI
jgi:hypothetical protein